jgi:hypothetical protein
LPSGSRVGAELAESDGDSCGAPTDDDLAAVAGQLETLIADGQQRRPRRSYDC